MFSIAVNEQYPTPVEVEIPTGNGKSTKHSFIVYFNRKSQAELDEIHRRLNALQLRDGEELLLDEDLMKEVLAGWEGVQGKDGTPLEFNDENMVALLNIYPVRPTLVTAFFGSIKTSKRKN
jgi:hypothetical protein